MGKMTINFNDGVSVRVDGPYRVIELEDGFYCVGHGSLVPVDSQEEGQLLANELRRIKENQIERRQFNDHSHCPERRINEKETP